MMSTVITKMRFIICSLFDFFECLVRIIIGQVPPLRPAVSVAGRDYVSKIFL